MQRSTISLIVEQLIAENWVLEGSTGRLPRGRHPAFLRLNDERVIIAVDIRPTRLPSPWRMRTAGSHLRKLSLRLQIQS